MRVKEGDQTHGLSDAVLTCAGSGESLGALTAPLGWTRKITQALSLGHSPWEAGPAGSDCTLTTRPMNPRGTLPSLSPTYTPPASKTHLNSTRWGGWKPLQGSHTGVGERPATTSPADVVCPTPWLHPFPRSLFPRPLQSLPSVIRKPVFPKCHFHQVIHSYHRPKSFLQPPTSAPKGFWEPL